MQKLQLFAPEERAAIDDRYGDLLLYEVIRGASFRLGEKAATLALHPAEVFYHALCSVDNLRAMNRIRAKAFCQDELWPELAAYFREHTPTAAPEDVSRAIVTIMQATAEILLRSKAYGSVTQVAGIRMQIQRNAPSLSVEVSYEFGKSIRDYGEGEFEAEVRDYWAGQQVLSEEIDSLLDSLAVEEPWQTRARRAGWTPPAEECQNVLCDSAKPTYEVHVHGDWRTGNETMIDKNYAPVVDNHDDGKIMLAGKQPKQLKGYGDSHK